MAELRVLFVVLAAVGGCTSCSPQTDARIVTVDEWNAARQVVLLAPEGVTPAGVLPLGEKHTMSCAGLTTDRAATQAGTLHYLQVLAYRAGASAMTNVVCEPPRLFPLAKNCRSGVACGGIAVRLPD